MFSNSRTLFSSPKWPSESVQYFGLSFLDPAAKPEAINSLCCVYTYCSKLDNVKNMKFMHQEINSALNFTSSPHKV